MIRRVSVLLLVFGLGGCANMAHHNQQDSPWLIQRSHVKVPVCTPLSKEHELWLGLSQKMMIEGRLHAALANIEQLPNELPEARLNKAQILRQLQRPEAESLYASLLDSCLMAAGYHGLAQMAVAKQAYPQALSYLQQAIAIAPTNDAMRNDLGVVYLNLRQLDEAQFELVTALELNEGDPRAATNLVTLLVYQARLDQAAKLVSRYQLSTAQYQGAVARAERLKQADSQESNLMAARQTAWVEPSGVSETSPVPQVAEQAPSQTPVQTQTQAQAQNWAAVIQPALPSMTSISGLNSVTTAKSTGNTNSAATSQTSDVKTQAARGVQQVAASSSREIVPLAITQGVF